MLLKGPSTGTWDLGNSNSRIGFGQVYDYWVPWTLRVLHGENGLHAPVPFGVSVIRILWLGSESTK